MSSATVTTKGQITIPKEIRDYLKLETGSKEEIITTLEMMVQSSGFEFENRSVVYQALQRTKQGRADFLDYLIGVIARQIGCTETVTFDQKLRTEPGFHCL